MALWSSCRESVLRIFANWDDCSLSNPKSAIAHFGTKIASGPRVHDGNQLPRNFAVDSLTLSFYVNGIPAGHCEYHPNLRVQLTQETASAASCPFPTQRAPHPERKRGSAGNTAVGPKDRKEGMLRSEGNLRYPAALRSARSDSDYR
jgi:hypothetical protein